jgi:hypothetical protein
MLRISAAAGIEEIIGPSVLQHPGGLGYRSMLLFPRFIRLNHRNRFTFPADRAFHGLNINPERRICNIVQIVLTVIIQKHMCVNRTFDKCLPACKGPVRTVGDSDSYPPVNRVIKVELPVSRIIENIRCPCAGLGSLKHPGPFIPADQVSGQINVVAGVVSSRIQIVFVLMEYNRRVPYTERAGKETRI